MDINAKLFFEKYNIPQQELTLEHREMLENVLIMMPFIDKEVEYEGRKIPSFKYYRIQYDVDQWWGAYAMELVEANGVCYYNRAFKGEGDSQALALLALLIEMYEILDEEQRQEIREVFNVEDNNNEQL